MTVAFHAPSYRAAASDLTSLSAHWAWSNSQTKSSKSTAHG